MKRVITASSSVDYSYFKKFKDVINEYMEPTGEGDNLASQAVTAINKIIYRWYNDGDVFDNTTMPQDYGTDISSYANWLYSNVSALKPILDRVYDCFNDNQYEQLLKELADVGLNFNLLSKYEKQPAVGTIYNCSGDFRLHELEDDEDSGWW